MTKTPSVKKDGSNTKMHKIIKGSHKNKKPRDTNLNGVMNKGKKK